MMPKINREWNIILERLGTLSNIHDGAFFRQYLLVFSVFVRDTPLNPAMCVRSSQTENWKFLPLATDWLARFNQLAIYRKLRLVHSGDALKFTSIEIHHVNMFVYECVNQLLKWLQFRRPSYDYPRMRSAF